MPCSKLLCISRKHRRNCFSTQCCSCSLFSSSIPGCYSICTSFFCSQSTSLHNVLYISNNPLIFCITLLFSPGRFFFILNSKPTLFDSKSSSRPQMCQPPSIHKEVTLELCMPPHRGAEVPSAEQNWHPEQHCACATFPPASAQLIPTQKEQMRSQ